MDTNEKHEVRCCKYCTNAEPCANAWKQKCDSWEPTVYARSKVGGECSGQLDFYKAKAFCSSAGGRLCSAEEMLEECARGTGCKYDQHMIWVGMYDGGWCDQDSDCVNGVCTNGECIPEANPWV